MTETENLLFEIDQQGIAKLTLNRPEIHNAFDDAMIENLITKLAEVNTDPNVRAVVLAANGDNFCAGADLNWMQQMANYTAAENLADSQKLAQLMQCLNDLSKPTLALVQGAVLGGGVGLVACCDCVIATESAYFCLSEVKIGLIPAVISPYVIAKIGIAQARRYFLTAEHFSVAEAKAFGLVHERVATEELQTWADKIIQKLHHNSPQAITAAKRLIQAVANQPIKPKLIEDTVKRIADIRVSKEGQEGLKAFLEKREPSWVS